MMNTVNRQIWIRATACAAVLMLSAPSIVLSQDTQAATERPLFVLDESTWALFYDLPSRRFRNIRDAFIRKDFEAAENDLVSTIGFMSIEAERAVGPLQAPLNETIARLQYIRENLADTSVSAGDLDAAFARAHWLLAQHYLVLSRNARDSAQHKTAGRYLWATAHHLERAVLWSNARIDQSLVDALDSAREMGSRLQASDRPERVYRDKPIIAANKTLIRIGEHLDRKVWITAEPGALE